MRIAIVGAGGQLGQELTALLGADALAWRRPQIDLTDAESLAAAIEQHRPDAVINAAAYNLVDQAESEPLPAFEVNAVGPGRLAQACAAHGIPCVHVSTDYVFGADASRTVPYREEDCPGPVSVYGVSKAAGEQMVRAATDQHLIVRTCGLYGHPGPGGKGNFVQTIRRLATTREELRVVNDQRCTPTSAADLAAALLALLAARRWGTYHSTNAGDCTWYDFAAAIVSLLHLPTRVVPCSSAEFPRPARRPAYSVLDGTKLHQTLGRPQPPWQDSLAAYLHQPPAATK